jgi:hypothetical protein
MAKSRRPDESPPQRPTLVDVATSRCPKCGSTERTDYSDTLTTVVDAPGDHPRFGLYNKVVLRRTKCKACDQARIDRSYELTANKIPE